ncbi:MAG: STAS domain-containing protein [Patescibacteria group bacterium]
MFKGIQVQETPNGNAVILPEQNDQGEVKKEYASKFKDVISEQLGLGKTIVIIDMTNIVFIDNIVLQEIVSQLKRLRDCDGDLRLFGLSSRIKDFLEITGMLRFFKIFPSVEEADQAPD